MNRAAAYKNAHVVTVPDSISTVVSAFLAVAKALILQTDLLVRLDCPVSFLVLQGR
jgi:hypothetical protein